jgi:hypothetical protein
MLPSTKDCTGTAYTLLRSTARQPARCARHPERGLPPLRMAFWSPGLLTKFRALAAVARTTDRWGSVASVRETSGTGRKRSGLRATTIKRVSRPNPKSVALAMMNTETTLKRSTSMTPGDACTDAEVGPHRGRADHQKGGDRRPAARAVRPSLRDQYWLLRAGEASAGSTRHVGPNTANLPRPEALTCVRCISARWPLCGG